jgi:hypothetical protein
MLCGHVIIAFGFTVKIVQTKPAYMYSALSAGNMIAAIYFLNG